ncbi:MAG: HU family DNA-binding protein [Candidatus Thermoplasmatota archaeon]
MRRRDLDSQVGARLDLAAATVGQVLDTALEFLIGDLVRTGRLEWRGFGTFTVRTYPVRKIHNPTAGKIIVLRARKHVGFKPSRHLRTLLTPRPTRRARRVATKRRSRTRQ